jgi:putative acetyltransferase
MIIREARDQDQEAIHQVVSAAFGQVLEARLVRDLEDAGDAVLSLVAEDQDAVLGHVLLSRMSAPFPALALAPVSVRPADQGKGVGSALVRAALERVHGGDWAAVFVLGDPAYYERFGFEQDAAGGFSTPYAGPYFMVLPLASGLPATTGDLRHAAAFLAFG